MPGTLGVQGRQQQGLPRDNFVHQLEPHWQRQRPWLRQQQKTRVKKRQRPQEQPKSNLTSGGNRHRPRRRSLWLSDTDIEMGAFLALHAQRVGWSTLARRPQLNRVHTVNVNAADIPGSAQKVARKSLKWIPVVKPQCFSSCRDQI